QKFVSSIKAHSIEEYSSETFKRFLNYLSKNDINNACQQVNKNNLLKPVEDELRLPPLFYLINKNYIKYISYIKKLIDNGVDLNGWIRLKIKNGLVIKVTALGYAVFSAGELKSINALKTRGNIIKNLIKAGSDPEMSIITEKEAIEDKVNNVLSIEEPLAHAIDKKYRQIINVLLLQKVSPDAQGKTERTLFTALTRAVAVYSETKQREDLDTITRLIEAKVNLNQETIIIESGGFTTDRALGRAIQDKNIEVIGLLLTAGCDPNLTRHIKFQKRHPVFDILDTMDPDFLTVFLSHGNKVDLNVKYTGKSKYKDGKSMRVLPVLHYIVFLHFNRIKNIVNEMDSLAVRQERVTGTEEQTTKIIALLKDVNFAALSDSPEITAETWYRETIPEFREYKLTFSDDLFSPPALPDSALE
nr:hypothetical protein [Endozoicomonas sp.]